MAHDREDTAKSKELTPAVALLLEADRKADELVARASTDAKKIVANAKRRAQQIRERGGPAGRAVVVSQELYVILRATAYPPALRIQGKSFRSSTPSIFDS